MSVGTTNGTTNGTTEGALNGNLSSLPTVISETGIDASSDASITSETVQAESVTYKPGAIVLTEDGIDGTVDVRVDVNGEAIIPSTTIDDGETITITPGVSPNDQEEKQLIGPDVAYSIETAGGTATTGTISVEINGVYPE